MAKESMPFELKRPDANTPVTNATEIDYADIPLECGLVYDISVAHAVSNVPAQYESLSAALGTNGANIPQDVRMGGMTVKFINSASGKYEQWNLKASSWSIDTSDWALDIDTYNIPVDKIAAEYTQSEEKAIIYETDGGTQVGKIDSTGADFINLKRGGQQVARMSDLPTVPTLDTSIGNNPSSSHTPSSKAVKEYVDAKQTDLPITEETTASEDEEMEFTNDAGSHSYAKVGSYGVKAKAYLDMQGKNVIPTKDTTIDETPSATNVPTSKAVADYVKEHSGDNYPISKENTAERVKIIVIRNSADSEDVIIVTDEGLRAKTYMDMQGNPIGGASVRHISGFNYLVFS